MKKNLISIVLLLGMVAFNAGMLCKARCVGSHKEKRFDVAGISHAQAFCTTHHDRRQAMIEPGGSHGSGSGIKCGCSIDEADSHLDLNFIRAAVDLTPKANAVSTIMTADSIVTSLASIPPERPPRRLA